MAQIMRVTVDGQSHEVDLERLTFAEARAIERVTGETLAGMTMNTASITMLQALIWVVMKRDDSRLTFSDLDDRAMSDIEMEAVTEADSVTVDDADPTPAIDPA